MNEVFCLDPNYSTTRRVTYIPPVYAQSADAKFDWMLTLASSKGRKGEGGLRTNKYFKVDKSSEQKTEVNSMPLITIITAVFNAEKTLEDTILSVINQSYSNIEFIIIDGGSTDGSVDIIKKYQHAIDYWVSEPDDGIYDAWNKGVQLAGGSWISFLGADDFLYDVDVMNDVGSYLEKVLYDTRVVYGQVMLLNELGQHIHAAGQPWGEIRNRFKQVMCIPHQGVMHRRSLFEHYGNFDKSFRIAGDYEFLLRELKTRDAVFIPQIIITGMRQGGVSSTPQNSLRTLHEIRRAQKLHGLRWPGRIWFLALVRSHIRTWLWSVLGEKRVRKLLDFYRWIMKLPPYWTKL